MKYIKAPATSLTTSILDRLYWNEENFEIFADLARNDSICLRSIQHSFKFGRHV